MMSPFLEQKLRSKHEVYRDILANCAETYLVIDRANAEPYVREGDIGQGFLKVVRDIAEGQYDCPVFFAGRPTKTYEGPIAVVRFSLRDHEADDVTEKVAEAVLKHLIATDDPRPCPFLDEVMPDWRQRSGLTEAA